MDSRYVDRGRTSMYRRCESAVARPAHGPLPTVARTLNVGADGFPGAASAAEVRSAIGLGPAAAHREFSAAISTIVIAVGPGNSDALSWQPLAVSAQVGALLARVYSLVAEDKPRHALREISNAILDHLTESDFGFVDELIRRIDVAAAGLTVLVGVSGFTRTRKERLANRVDFVRRAQAHVAEVRVGQARESLLRAVL